MHIPLSKIFCGFLALAIASVPLAAQTGAAATPKSKVKAAEPTLIARPPYVQTFRVGDRVQVYYNSWYPATIREIGKGDYRGFYRVVFDDFQRQRWVDDDELKRIPPGATHKAAFLTGTYKCYRRERPKKAAVIDVLVLEPNGDYHLSDDTRVGRYMLAADDKLIWEGGGLDDADSHIDGTGQLHVVRTRHIHWSDKTPQPLHCVTGGD